MQPNPPARSPEPPLEDVLRGSPVTVLCAGRDHRYLSIHNPPPGLAPNSVLGKSDDQIFGSEAALAIIEAKRGAIEDGKARELTASLEIGDRQQVFDILIKLRRDGEGRVAGTYLLAFDASASRREQEKLRLLAREADHRSKNLLTVIQAMARQSANHAERIDDFVESFLGRLQALSQSHDLLTQEAAHGVLLADVVRSQIGHRTDGMASQYHLEGESFRLSADATQHIGLAIHELATNALKHGALSAPGGEVFISWRRQAGADGVPALLLSWRECGGPKVEPPGGTGFGHVVLNKIAARALDADVATDFAPEGLRWSLSLPWTHVLESP